MCYRSAGLASNAAAVLAIAYLIGGFGVRALTVTVGDQTAEVGENVTLQCSFSTTATSPVRTLTWTFTSGSSTEQNVYSLATGFPPTVEANYTDRVEFDGDLSTGQANLKLFDAQVSDEGTYGCDVFVNTDGTVKRTFQLDVTVPTTAPPPIVPTTAPPPIVPTTAPPPIGSLKVTVGGELSVKPGGNATLKCSYTTTLNAATGFLTWSFKDKKIYQRRGSNESFGTGYDDRLTFIGDLSRGNASIKLNNMMSEDIGTYTCSVTVQGAGQDSGSIVVTFTKGLPWWGILLFILGIIILVVGVPSTIYCLLRVTITITPHPSPSRKVDVKWTAKCKASYQVLYRLKGSPDWIHRPKVSTDNYPEYKYMVDFAKDGTYEVCVQTTIACCPCYNVKSKIEEVTVPDEDSPAASGSLNGPNMPVSLHGNDIPKTDVPLVVMITEGQSHKVKLDPIIIDKQNPPEKKEKKKKKIKKVNKVNASDEDKKPED